MIFINGVNSYAATGFEYFGPHVTVGNFTSIAEKVTWCGAMNHVCVAHPEAVSTFNFRERWHADYFEGGGISRGPIVVGNDVWIGREAWVMDGVTIGDGAIVGARTMVAKDVPPYSVFVGSPGRVAHYRFKPEQIEALLRIKWWEWPRELIIERMADFRNIEEFVKKYDLPKTV